MIKYHYETEFGLPTPNKHTDWIIQIVARKGYEIEELNYIFCDDLFLLDLNKRFLNHDYFTDILTFPAEAEGRLMGDIFISVERVKENAELFQTGFDDELRRVMIHGALHLMGISDSTPEEKEEMRREEDEALELFHVKH